MKKIFYFSLLKVFKIKCMLILAVNIYKYRSIGDRKIGKAWVSKNKIDLRWFLFPTYK